MDGSAPSHERAVQQSAKFAAYGERRFGRVNWLGLQTLYMKEVRRFMKVAAQTVFAPVISTLLFLVVFTQAFGAARPAINGVGFAEFLTPGLVMMAILTNAFANSSSSILIGKVQGSIVDVLMPPLSAGEQALAFIAGAATRGLLVGFITAVTCAVFMIATGNEFGISNIFAILFFAISASSIFGMLGLIGGVWAEKFDNLAAVNNFVITPLTFLSGTFYSIQRLPEPFQTASYFNPVFYMIDGFRYGFTGVSEASPWVGAGVNAALMAVCVFLPTTSLKPATNCAVKQACEAGKKSEIPSGFFMNDRVIPFQVGESAVRGRIVDLSETVNEILSAHQFPTNLSELVGEAAMLTALMGSSLKFDGKLIFQTQGDGPVSMLVADYTTDGAIRATAKTRDPFTSQLRGAGLFGKGHIALTIDQGAAMERYQGVTPIEGVTLGDVASGYFMQSEQIPTSIRLAVGKLSVAGEADLWRAGGVIAQFMPGEGGTRERGEEVLMGAEDQDQWERAAAFVQSTQDDELLDPSISMETLLYRLFHEDGVRAFDEKRLHRGCSCNPDKIAVVLQRYSPEELAEMVEGGIINVSCDFCRRDFRFSADGQPIEGS